MHKFKPSSTPSAGNSFLALQKMTMKTYAQAFRAMGAVMVEPPLLYIDENGIPQNSLFVLLPDKLLIFLCTRYLRICDWLTLRRTCSQGRRLVDKQLWTAKTTVNFELDWRELCPTKTESTTSDDGEWKLRLAEDKLLPLRAPKVGTGLDCQLSAASIKANYAPYCFLLAHATANAERLEFTNFSKNSQTRTELCESIEEQNAVANKNIIPIGRSMFRLLWQEVFVRLRYIDISNTSFSLADFEDCRVAFPLMQHLIVKNCVIYLSRESIILNKADDTLRSVLHGFNRAKKRQLCRGARFFLASVAETFTRLETICTENTAFYSAGSISYYYGTEHEYVLHKFVDEIQAPRLAGCCCLSSRTLFTR